MSTREHDDDDDEVLVHSRSFCRMDSPLSGTIAVSIRSKIVVLLLLLLVLLLFLLLLLAITVSTASRTAGPDKSPVSYSPEAARSLTVSIPSEKDKSPGSAGGTKAPRVLATEDDDDDDDDDDDNDDEKGGACGVRAAVFRAMASMVSESSQHTLESSDGFVPVAMAVAVFGIVQKGAAASVALPPGASSRRLARSCLSCAAQRGLLPLNFSICASEAFWA
mmetsp:Transcript_2737/g.7309  ORF Transcript_2737/g.7309 Transcript_2737/m.7309 type:complete len:221 (+) Transcript_2737:402-1064(+)